MDHVWLRDGFYMKKYKVYITRRIPEAGIDLLKRECGIVEVRSSEEVPTEDELTNAIHGMDALLCLLTDPVSSDVISAGRDLKIIANYAVGYNNIDVQHAKTKGIFVTNTPDVLTDATADIAWSLILSVTRRIVPADRFTREGKFKGWDAFLFQGRSIQGKKLGIIGMGRISSKIWI